ncbi:MAG: DUF4249 domain-containing protein [Dysgonamonadaceae bacterium]|nr:DUF4249 domain-containing protein [Dysgonamonadaceae bacterium]
MKQYIPTVLFIFFIGCFISCEKTIEFKGAISDPLLVMNGVLTPDSVVSIHLSQSRFILGDVAPFTHISDATVSLFVNGSLKEQLTYDSEGIYRGTYFPKAGDEIKIEVIASGHKAIKSQTVIPHPLNIVSDSTVTIRDEEYTSPGPQNIVFINKVRSMQLQLKLTDNINEENYYYIKAIQNFYRKDELVMNRMIELNLSEMLKNNSMDTDNIFEEIFGEGGSTYLTDNLFSDFYVNGKEILFDFSLSDPVETIKYVNGEIANNENDEELEATLEYIIEVGEFSKDMYQYVISGNKAANAEDAGFSEPVQVHSNIENGIGILGAYNSYRFVSRFETKNFPYYMPREK